MRQTKPLTARTGKAPAKDVSRPWKREPDHMRRRRSRRHAPRRVGPHIRPPDSMPTLTPQTERPGKALERRSRCARSEEQRGRGARRARRSGVVSVSYSLAPEDSARAQRKHEQKQDEINRQRPFVSPVETREVFDDPQHQAGHGRALNGTHAPQHHHDKGLERELVADGRIEVKDGKQQSAGNTCSGYTDAE